MLKLIELMELIKNYVMTTHLNKVPELDNLQIFDQPLVGIASAEDSFFLKLKEADVIGPHHLTPGEWLPGAKTVISYFLPFSKVIRESNRLTTDLPSSEWLYGRIEGEALNETLRKYLVEQIQSSGGQAIAPAVDKNFQVVNRRSNWSERHAAFIAGLGTFNLSKSFITEKGCAGRFGSVITNINFKVTPRQYQDIYEYCTNCGLCISRCPVSAITPEGKDHQICSEFLDNVIKPRYKPRYGCGKCQTAVPCENGIPPK